MLRCPSPCRSRWPSSSGRISDLRVLFAAPETAFDWVLGHWIFERTVSPHASVRGEAEINLISQEEALYRERAQVTLASGEVLSGTQKYFYRRRECGFDIYFAQTGLLFQSVQFRYDGHNLAATAEHLCSPDHYASDYILQGKPSSSGFAVSPENRMFVRHIVRGPAKHYESVTTFQRMS